VHEPRLRRRVEALHLWDARALWVVSVALLSYRFAPGPLPEQTWLPMLGAALLFPLTLHAERAQPLLLSRPVQFLGRVSYSLYLWHFPIIMLLARHGAAIAPILALPLSILAAAVLHPCIEQPPRRLGHWLTPAKNARPGVAAPAAGAGDTG